MAVQDIFHLQMKLEELIDVGGPLAMIGAVVGGFTGIPQCPQNLNVYGKPPVTEITCHSAFLTWHTSASGLSPEQVIISVLLFALVGAFAGVVLAVLFKVLGKLVSS